MAMPNHHLAPGLRESGLMASRPKKLLLAGALLVLGAFAVAEYVAPDHSIVYRASAPTGCRGHADYTTTGAVDNAIDFEGDWQSEELTLEHGESASLVVTGPGCREHVRCEIIEDGVSVSSLERPFAICTSWTGR